MKLEILRQIVLHSFLILVVIGACMSAAIGLGLLFAPQRFARINAFWSRWIDTRKFESAMDRPRWTERFFYRHHRLVGIVMSIASWFVLYHFLLTPNIRHRVAMVTTDVAGLLDAGVSIVVIGGVWGATIGLILVFKPSLIRDIEASANKWISTDKVGQKVNEVHMRIDLIVLHHRKTFGVIMIAAAAMVITRILPLLLSGNWRLL
jgi:hypothetical protein